MQARFKIFLAATTVFLCGAAQADITCRRRLNFDPPCRLNFDPGAGADQVLAGCG
jgi:hypothetical protein